MVTAVVVILLIGTLRSTTRQLDDAAFKTKELFVQDKVNG